MNFTKTKLLIQSYCLFYHFRKIEFLNILSRSINLRVIFKCHYIIQANYCFLTKVIGSKYLFIIFLLLIKIPYSQVEFVFHIFLIPQFFESVIY